MMYRFTYSNDVDYVSGGSCHVLIIINYIIEVHVCVCWLLPSNQSSYRQIAGYMRGMRDPRLGH